MSRLNDLTGLRFGRWTVLERRPKPPYMTGTDAWWLARCECGRERLVRGTLLVQGRSQSCGCLRSDRIRESFQRKRLERGA